MSSILTTAPPSVFARSSPCCFLFHRWWQSAIPAWYLFIIVPGFTVALAMWTKEKLKSKQVRPRSLASRRVSTPFVAPISELLSHFLSISLPRLWSSPQRPTSSSTSPRSLCRTRPRSRSSPLASSPLENDCADPALFGPQLCYRRLRYRPRRDPLVSYWSRNRVHNVRCSSPPRTCPR